MKIRAVIVDRDITNIQLIKSYLLNFKNIELIALFSDPIKAISLIENNLVDILFLEFSLPNINRINISDGIKIKPNIIITTEFRDEAIEVFGVDAIDYLVKPIPFNRFENTMNKIMH